MFTEESGSMENEDIFLVACASSENLVACTKSWMRVAAL